MDQTYSTTSTIFAALSTLSSPDLAAVTLSVSADLRRHRSRLAAILSDQILFSLTLTRLRGLSLPAKTAILAAHLLSSLRLVLPENRSFVAGKPALPRRDLDVVLLLLFLCEARHRRPDIGPESLLRLDVLARVHADDMLTLCTSGMGSTALVPYAEAAGRCLRLLGVDVVAARCNADVYARSHGFVGLGADLARRHRGDVESRFPASVAAVVSLPSVSGGGGDCAVCREEMGEGRDVCRVPCGHVFHWKCVIPWLRETNTCPCCRFQLPTDDIAGEIRRLWGLLLRMAGAGKDIP